MSGTTPEQEPSIEEILASIRQIISDDDEGAPAAPEAPEAVPEPEPITVTPEPEPAPKEDILELKDPLPEEKPSIIEMVDEPVVVLPPAAIDKKIEKEIEKEDDIMPLPPEPADLGDVAIFSAAAREAALSGFSKLAHNIPIDRGTTPRASTSDGVTVEDIIRDMLQPMLREWLDDNLPGIIEKLVQKELEKLARKIADD